MKGVGGNPPNHLMKSGSKFSVKYALILLFLFILVTSELIFFGTKKQGFHVDEMYMYGTANSEYLSVPHLSNDGYRVKDWMLEYGPGESLLQFFKNIGKDFSLLKESHWHFKNTTIYADYLVAKENSNDMYRPDWVTGEYFHDYITVTESNRFNYFSVLNNFRGDDHPPLYALFLHTICSFFPGVFSKWFGLTLNIVITLLTLLLLYVTVRDYLGGRNLAILVTACYGLSAAAGDIVTFIRLYALVTFMTIGFVYAHLRLVEADWEWSKKDRRILILFTLFGYLSQYYFVLFAIGAAIASIISMAVKKKGKSILRYILTMAITGVIGIVVWPFSINAVFHGSVTQGTFGALFSLSDLSYRVRVMLDVLTSHTLGLPGWAFVSFLALVTIAYFVFKAVKKETFFGKVEEKGLLIIVPFTLYFTLVSKSIPFLVDRYIFLLFPWVSVLMICSFYVFIRKFIKKETIRLYVSIGFSLLLAFSSNALRLGNNYLFEGGQELDKVDGKTDCIYVLPAGWWNESVDDCLLLSQCEKVLVIREDDLDKFNDSYTPTEGADLTLIIKPGVDEGVERSIIDNYPKEESGFTLVEKERKTIRDKAVIRYTAER